MNRTFHRPIRLARTLAVGSLLGLTAVAGVGCQSDAQWGGLIGAGLGALAGQAIGGDTTGTLIGTAVGAGAGYVIGNESDKSKARNSGYRGDYEYREYEYREYDYSDRDRRRGHDHYCRDCGHYHRTYDHCR